MTMTNAQVASLVPQWVRCREWILPALALCGGTHSEEDVLAGLLTARFQLWPGKNSAIVTSVDVNPRNKVVHFWLVGGDLEEVKQMQEPILAWAKSLGCTVATATGRKGWERVLPEWKVQAIMIAREI